MGRSVPRSRPHRIWPVAASASTAPLAFTPPGAPVTWIAGLTDGLGRDGVAGGCVGAGGRVGAIAACLAGRGLSFPAAGAQAVTPMAITATAVSETIRALNRIPLALPCRRVRARTRGRDPVRSVIKEPQPAGTGRESFARQPEIYR